MSAPSAARRGQQRRVVLARLAQERPKTASISCWSPARGCPPRRRSPVPDAAASTTVTAHPGRPARRRARGRPARRRPGHVAASSVTATESTRPGATCQRWGTLSAMELVRTPDESFADLPGYPFEPRYAGWPTGSACTTSTRAGRRPRPSSCCTGSRRGRTCTARDRPPGRQGLRAVAPDLVGFGRSDKPMARTAHSVQAHVEWIAQFVEPRTQPRSPWWCRTGADPSASAYSAPRPGSSAASWPPTPRSTRPTPRWPDGWPGLSMPAADGRWPSRRPCSTTSA